MNKIEKHLLITGAFDHLNLEPMPLGQAIEYRWWPVIFYLRQWIRQSLEEEPWFAQRYEKTSKYHSRMHTRVLLFWGKFIIIPYPEFDQLYYDFFLGHIKISKYPNGYPKSNILRCMICEKILFPREVESCVDCDRNFVWNE